MSECDYTYDAVSKVYLGHDNTVTIVPYSDIVARTHFNMSSATEVTASLDTIGSVVTGDDITASSTDVPVTIWWEQVGTTTEWRINFKAGLFVSVVPASYKMRVVVVNPDYLNGLVLADDILVEVVDTP